MATRQLGGDAYHLSLSIGKALWDDLAHAALPIKLKDGSFDLGRVVYRGVRQLQMKEKVVALLEDREPPPVLVRAKDRAATAWRDHREQVYQTVDRIVHVDGDWRLEIDDDGTQFRYARQKIGLDAQLKAVASGKAYLLDRNVEFPFTIERRLAARLNLEDIRYDRNKQAVVGDMAEPSIDFGDHVVLRLLNEVAGYLAENQLTRFNPVPILKKEQVESLVAPAGGALHLKMGVDDVTIEVSDQEFTLRVRFGFTQKQLTGD